MRSILASVLCLAAVAHQPADASESWGAAEALSAALSANGEISRRVWKPAFASTQLGAMRLSMGVALGLRGVVRDGLDRRATPALMLDVGNGSGLALLPAGRGQAMLVWSQPVH